MRKIYDGLAIKVKDHDDRIINLKKEVKEMKTNDSTRITKIEMLRTIKNTRDCENTVHIGGASSAQESEAVLEKISPNCTKNPYVRLEPLIQKKNLRNNQDTVANRENAVFVGLKAKLSKIISLTAINVRRAEETLSRPNGVIVYPNGASKP